MRKLKVDVSDRVGQSLTVTCSMVTRTTPFIAQALKQCQKQLLTDDDEGPDDGVLVLVAAVQQDEPQPQQQQEQAARHQEQDQLPDKNIIKIDNQHR